MSTRTIIAVLILLGVLLAIRLDRKEVVAPVAVNDKVVCTMDAKQCPDGSYVGRIAPDCKFAECTVNIKQIPPDVKFGIIKGVVGLQPACGGPLRDPPEENCIFKAYETSISFISSSNKVYKANSGPDGKYSIKLPIGTYKVTAKGGETLPRCPTDTVVVNKDQTTNHTFDCESGLR